MMKPIILLVISLLDQIFRLVEVEINTLLLPSEELRPQTSISILQVVVLLVFGLLLQDPILILQVD